MSRFPFYLLLSMLMLSAGMNVATLVASNDRGAAAALAMSEANLVSAQAIGVSRRCHEAAQTHLILYDALSSVAATPYRNPGNNCYDHSKALTRKLAEEGIASSILINHDRSHAWVAVWIDANTGAFVPTIDRYGSLLEMRAPDTKVMLSR